MFDEKLWYIKCEKSFAPYYLRYTDDKQVYSGFIVKSGEIMHVNDKMLVHDKMYDMWEISYPNGRLFYTQLCQLKECCITLNQY